MNSRLDFLTKLMGGSALSVLPATTQAFLTTSAANDDTIIDSVEVVRLTGPYKCMPGVNRQYQSQPIHIYPDLHPAPYKDNPTSVETTL
jgi:L-rhamnonate dehydratase